jgi:glycosyltransferase involved in cell wall biosynthesis
MKLLIVGSFFSTSSFSRVNSSLFNSLVKLNANVKVYLDAEYLDYFPTERELNNSCFKNRYTSDLSEVDTVFFFHFPRSFDVPMGLEKFKDKFLIVNVAWEDVVYPDHFVREINEFGSIVCALSNHVRNVLINSGVMIPIFVLSNGVEETIPSEKLDISTNKKFKFLHISSGKARKGVDVLIKAYDMAFSDTDDATLIIKTSNTVDNVVPDLLSKRSANAEIISIDNNGLKSSQIAYLQEICQCHVYPSRAEGFGLPILECMMFGNIAITTRYSGQMDFCNDENSVLIDYKMRDAVESEVVYQGSKWAEPDIAQLAKEMKNIYTSFQSGNFEKEYGEIAQQALKTARIFSWDNAASRLLEIIDQTSNIKNLKSKLRLAMITPFNDETGIGEYSKQIVLGIKNSCEKFVVFANSDVTTATVIDEDYVIRNWKCGEKDFSQVLKDISDMDINLVHIQYHSSSFFSEDALSYLISILNKMNVKVLITLHSVIGRNFDHIKNITNLNLCEQVIICSKKDFRYAQKTLKNISYLPLFVDRILPYSKNWLKSKLGFDKDDFVVSTHGLLNTNKSIAEIIDGFVKFLQLHEKSILILLNAVSINNFASNTLKDEITKKIDSLNLNEKIVFIDEFLPVEIVNTILNASDAYILAYLDAGESGSAAVKKGLQNLVPTIVTDIKQFDEYQDEVLKIKNNSPQEIFDALKLVFENETLRDTLIQKTKDYTLKNDIVNAQINHLLLYSKALKTLA